MKISNYPTVLLFFILFFARPAASYDVTASLGNLCEYIGKIQTDEEGSKNICQFTPYLASSYDYALTTDFILSPELGFSVPKSGRDEHIKKMNLFILTNGIYKLSNIHLIAGLGLFFTRISSTGGTEELNNGTGTSSFPLPDSTIFTRNFILNLGLGMDINKDWSADLHSFVFNLLTSEDRAFSLAINGTYHFGEF